MPPEFTIENSAHLWLVDSKELGNFSLAQRLGSSQDSDPDDVTFFQLGHAVRFASGSIAVAICVGHIPGMRNPAQVGQSVVIPYRVVMIALATFRRWSDKCQQNKPVNRLGEPFLEATRIHGLISIGSNRWFQF